MVETQQGDQGDVKCQKMRKRKMSLCAPPVLGVLGDGGMLMRSHDSSCAGPNTPKPEKSEKYQ